MPMREMRPILLICVVGCECKTFSEMKVADPDQLVSGAVLESVQRVLLDFERWSGREGVCVPEIRVVDGDDPRLDDVGGIYLGPRRPILLSADGSRLDIVARHELCHALDAREGFSAEHLDTFPEEAPPYSESAEERFADVCQVAPLDLSFALQVTSDCGMAADARAAELVLQEIYPLADLSAAVVDRVTVEIERQPESPPVGGMFSAKAVMDGKGIAVSVPTEGSGFPSVMRFDPETRETVTVQVPSEIGTDGGSFSLITGDGAVYLLEAQTDAPAWRIEFDGAGATAVSAPPMSATGSYVVGTIKDGAAWMIDVAADVPVFTRWDLTTLLVEEVGWPEDLSQLAEGSGWPGFGASVVSHSGGLSVVSPHALLRYFPDEQTWQVERFDGATSAELYRGATDGGRIVTFASMGWFHLRSTTLSVLLVFDSTESSWSLPGDPCGSAQVTGLPQLVGDNDESWMWDYGVDGGHDQWYFGRVDVAARGEQ